MESEFTIDTAARFSDSTELITEIVQRGISAFDQLAQVLADMSEVNHIRRRIDQLLMQFCIEYHSQSAMLIRTRHAPHTRHAMRARKMRRYHQAMIA